MLPPSSAAGSPAEPAAPRDPGRRRLLRAVPGLAVGAGLLRPRPARAGAQQYEALADQVRVALAAQIAEKAPPVREFGTMQERLAFIDWMGAMGERLKPRKPEYSMRVDFLRTLDYECRRAGLDRQMVLGLIQVESAFRKYAISEAGARGYMQVMPFWTLLIGDGDARKLFEMATNLRYGCVILRHYLDLERGDLFLALGRYNGSRGRQEYPNAVLGAWQTNWNYVPVPRPAS
jgi:soluble lytic murein transglycosylase-like protein